MAAITLVIAAINGVVIICIFGQYFTYSSVYYIFYKIIYYLHIFKGGNAQCQKKHHHLLYFVLIEYIVIG